MCGIAGSFNNPKAVSFVLASLKRMKNRGMDGYGVATEKGCFYDKGQVGRQSKAIGHCLHSIVGYVEQPFVHDDARFIANCEIYNWKELCGKHGIKARNDAELLFELILQSGIERIQEVLEEIDGVYAFAFWKGNRLILARDIIGMKPLWYSHSNGLSFASEKKAIKSLDVTELNPRQIIVYDIEWDRISFLEREFFEIHPEIQAPLGQIQSELARLLTDAVAKRIPGVRFGLLFSGGTDSAILAYMMKKMGLDFTCYTAALSGDADDLVFAKIAAFELGLKLKTRIVGMKDVTKYLKKVVPLIEDSNVVKVGVALPIYIACEMAKEDGVKVIFSGTGGEEIFAGYHRHKGAINLNEECIAGLRKVYERDTYRDDVISMSHNMELRVPFLDKNLVRFALRIPGQYKIVGEVEKWILRQVALTMGLPEKFAMRKKKAAQYGSKFDKAIETLTKKAGLKYKSEYLKRFYPEKNLKLAALFSSGKDSLYAMGIMQRQNYDISCLVTLKSKNPDSFMFHTPNIHMAEMQAEAMQLPIVVQVTDGEKEHELKDLKKALEKAKDKYGIKGVVTGALFSQYQRDRIEKICDSLGLTVFAPLWHMNQETELREIIRHGIKFMITKIAGQGLDKYWMGREITWQDVDRLVALSKEEGINVAGEGGEYESLVTDGPMFKSRIIVKKGDMKMENVCTGIYKIVSATLEKKNS